MTAPGPKSIILVFGNLLFLIGVILLVVGFVRGLQTAAFSLFLDKYPLQSYEENCALAYGRPIDNNYKGPSDQELQDEKKDCESRIERSRKVKQIGDISGSIGLIISGVVLAILFNPKSKMISKFSGV
jgi:hypothetical protein